MRVKITEEVEREPLCKLSFCPAPSDPDWHRCIVTDSSVIEHHHVEGRGKGRTLDTARIVPLSVAIHKKISLNEYGDAILTLADGSKMYRIWDLKNETVHESKPLWMQPGQSSQPQEVENRPESSTAALTATPVVEPPTAPAKHGWKAADITSMPDWQLVEQFDEFYKAAQILKLEAYRRVEAYRLKYAKAAGESWTQRAAEEFGLQPQTLNHYARAWQAFEQAITEAEAPEELKESFRAMGGGVWQVIGRLPEETWPQMSEIALNVVANTGVGRGLPARVAAKGQEEGIIPKSEVELRCPNCGNVALRGEYEKVER